MIILPACFLASCNSSEEEFNYTAESYYPEYFSLAEVRVEEYYRCNRQLPDFEKANELLKEEIDLARTIDDCLLYLKKTSDTKICMLCINAQKFEDIQTTQPEFADFAKHSGMREDVMAASMFELVDQSLRLTGGAIASSLDRRHIKD